MMKSRLRARKGISLASVARTEPRCTISLNASCIHNLWTFRYDSNLGVFVPRIGRGEKRFVGRKGGGVVRDCDRICRELLTGTRRSRGRGCGQIEAKVHSIARSSQGQGHEHGQEQPASQPEGGEAGQSNPIQSDPFASTRRRARGKNKRTAPHPPHTHWEARRGEATRRTQADADCQPSQPQWQ